MTIHSNSNAEVENESDADASKVRDDDASQGKTDSTDSSVNIGKGSAIDAEEEEEEEEETLIVGRKKHAKRTVLNDSDEDISQENEHRQTDNNNPADADEINDKGLFVEPSKTFVSAEENKRHSQMNADVFDDEMETDDADNLADKGISSEDNESEDVEISAALKRRLAKGASKKPKSSKGAHRERQNEMVDIHRETQRIIRESSVRLPYHVPPKLDLSVFLSRTEKKQQLLTSHSASPGLTMTRRDAVTVSGIASTLPAQEVTNKVSEVAQPISETSLENESLSLPSLSERLETRIGGSMNNTPVSALETPLHSELLNEDDLPDLIIEDENDGDGSKHVEENNSININENTSNVNHRDAQRMLLEDRSLSENETNADASVMKLSDSIQPKVIPTTSDHSNLKSASVNSETAECGNASTLSAMKKKSVISSSFLNSDLPPPRLSTGGPGSVIDLDEMTPKVNSRINSLVERLMKHSGGATAKSAKRSKNVEITTVSKEKVEGNRQELKLDKFVYTLDDNEDECDSQSHRPGVTLTLLKKKLRASMKAKREESLQKRYELFKQEYGVSYKCQRLEEDAQEEAELTDQTDTDEEESEDEGEVEMDDDEEERVMKQKKNPFLNDEAEDEDEDSDYEKSSDADESDVDESLNLKLDTQDAADDETRNSKISETSSSRGFIKTKTFDLFDDDSNPEMPSVSQKLGGNGLSEVEENPFKDLCTKASSKMEERKRLCTDDSDIHLLDPMETGQKDELNTCGFSQLKDSSVTSADLSFDNFPSLIPAGQRSRHDLATQDTSSSDIHALPSTSYSYRRQSLQHLDLVEKSKNTSCTPVTGKTITNPNDEFLDDFHLHLEDSQFRNVNCHEEESTARNNGLMHTNDSPLASSFPMSSLRANSQMSMTDELLNLCSGKFGGSEPAPDSAPMLIPTTNRLESDAIVDELIGLCSGQFTSLVTSTCKPSSQAKPPLLASQYQDSDVDPFKDRISDPCFDSGEDSPIKKKSQKKRRVAISDDDEDDITDEKTETHSLKRKADLFDDGDNDDNAESVNDGDDSFEVQSFKDNDNATSDEDIFSDDDKYEGQNSEKQKKYKGFTGKHGKIRKEFLEDEAELSGSEYESDEDLDMDEADDLLEEEAGDQDDLGTEEELRNQVHRVHLKTMIDQDAREIRLLQEQYLPDGDLQSDGTGRMRRYRWNNADDGAENDVRRNSDEEQLEDEDEDEAKRRTERLEREKFLEQLKEKETVEKSSHLLKLGQSFLKKSEPTTPLSLTPKTPLSGGVLKDSAGLFRAPGFSHGSFLNRNKASLAKLAEMNKAPSNPTLARNSRNFVFTTISNSEHNEKVASKSQVTDTPKSSRPPPKKRLCPEKRSSLPANSIFTLFDKAASQQ